VDCLRALYPAKLKKLSSKLGMLTDVESGKWGKN
jgi:hypothetical protein